MSVGPGMELNARPGILSSPSPCLNFADVVFMQMIHGESAGVNRGVDNPSETEICFVSFDRLLAAPRCAGGADIRHTTTPPSAG